MNVIEWEAERVVQEAEALTREAHERAVVNWDVVGEYGFNAAERAAHAVAQQFAQIEEDDLFQEALIYLATHPDEAERALDYGRGQPGVKGGEYGARKALTSMLTSRMREWAQRQAAAREREWKAALAVPPEQPNLDLYRNRPTPPEYEGRDYTPADVEAMLPMVWDDRLIGESMDERRPAPDMPKGPGAPKNRQGTWMAQLADVRRAWEKAPITWYGRRALLLCLCFGWTQDDVAAAEGVTRQAVAKRYNTALFALADWLNGEEAAA